MADYETQLKKLLSNKKSMGGDKYTAAIVKLKKDMKANNAGSFKKLLNNIKKQEREGKFDRGAEGETKKKLRAKMAKEPQTQLTKGVHAGSRTDKILTKGSKGIKNPSGEYGAITKEDSDTQVDLALGLSGETAEQRKARKEKMTPAKIAKAR